MASIAFVLISVLFFSPVSFAAENKTKSWNVSRYEAAQIGLVVRHRITASIVSFAKSVDGEYPEFNDFNCKKGRCLRKKPLSR